jgi:membrane-associated phospholipid phosphatase
MRPLTGGPKVSPGVVAGARPKTLPALIGLVLAAFVLVEVGLLLLGLLVTRVLAHGAVHRGELTFERDVAAHRTALWNQVTHYGSVLGSTNTVIVLTAIGCVVLFLRGHGPRLPVFLALAVAGETVLFVVASVVLHRMRPPIPHLDGAPPTSSFPSGHTAATVALWCGLAVGLARTHPRHPLLVLSRVLAVLLPVFVLAARLYRGMHWPTDVAASVVFTLVWLFSLRAILLPPDVPDRIREADREIASRTGT